MNNIPFQNKFLFGLSAVILAGIGIFIVVYAAEVLLLIFAALLVAIILATAAGWVRRVTRMPYVIALVLLLMIIAFCAWLSVLLVIPPLTAQFIELKETLPASFEQITQRLTELEGYQRLKSEFDYQTWIPKMDVLLSKTFPVAASIFQVLGGIASFFLVFVIGIFFAFNWNDYVKGLPQLFPPEKRQRYTEVVATVIAKLRYWLLGRFFGMAVISIMTIIGLKLLGIDLAVILGLIAGIMTFIPNIGPILAAVPAILLGFTVSPQMALWVLLLYAGTQAVESWLVTPIIESHAIRMPPSLVICAQILIGVLFGFWGLVLATPLAATAAVLVEELYVKDVLNAHEASEGRE